MHSVEPDIAWEIRVSNDAEVESEERNEGGVRDGSIESEERNEGIEECSECRVLCEEVATVLERVEEGESVGCDGD